MSSYRNIGLWLVLSAIWETAFMAIKAGLDPFDPAPVFFAAVRYDLAGIYLDRLGPKKDDPVPPLLSITLPSPERGDLYHGGST